MPLLNDLYTLVQQPQLQGTRCRLNPDSTIYRAHFPGHPITPGVCILMMVTEVAGVIAGRSLALDSAPTVKFLKPIRPLENPTIVIVLDRLEATDEHHLKARGTIKNDQGDLFTRFSLILR